MTVYHFAVKMIYQNYDTMVNYFVKLYVDLLAAGCLVFKGQGSENFVWSCETRFWRKQISSEEINFASWVIATPSRNSLNKFLEALSTGIICGSPIERKMGSDHCGSFDSCGEITECAFQNRV